MKTLIKNLSQIASPTGSCLIKGAAMKDLLLINDGAVYIEEGIIKLVGKTDEVLQKVDEAGCEVIDGTGKCCVPGFVDSHTHFVFGGYREKEFIKRLNGASYMEIMEMGGGIQASVEGTKEETFDTLYDLGKKRLDRMMQQGVTTVEGKSGYGLDLDTEVKQLNVMKALSSDHPMDIAVTFLGAHATPPEYKDNEDAYIDFIIDKVLPVVKKEALAEYCDIFCEAGVFSIEQSRKLLKHAKDMGFKVKIHADEIVTLGGGELGVELEATSADHLLMVSETGIEKLAKSNVSATLLPCTAFSLNKPYAPARKLIDAGCGVALASDMNPGSCFISSIPLIIATSAIQMKMSPEEILTGLTLNGAAALDRAERIGSIEEGKEADLVLLEYPDYRFLVYHTATDIVDTVIKGGKIVFAKKQFSHT